MPERYFENKYPDYCDEQYLSSVDQLNAENSSKIIQWIEQKLNHLESNLHRIDPTDGSVYTGNAGVALLYLHLALHFPERKQSYLSKSKELIDLALKNADGRVCTFLCGAPGPLAIAALIYHHLGDSTNTKQSIEKILSMKNIALSRSTPDEHLYGRVGYLFTLMFIRRELGTQFVPNSLIIEIVESIIRSGESYSQKTGSESNLMYQWHHTEYLGAAHGVSGIVYLLLKMCSEDSALTQLQSYIRLNLIPTINYLQTRQFPSGNYMSSNDSRSDKLVQWCHGAPGFVYAFTQAYRVTGDASFLKRAISAGDVVWRQGLLKKGFGLCHGASGNAYTLLTLYQTTRDMKWLHRAIQFAHFSSEMKEHSLSRQPDCPYSLFEGLAGTIYFLVDLLHPNAARFPGFD